MIDIFAIILLIICVVLSVMIIIGGIDELFGIIKNKKHKKIFIKVFTYLIIIEVILVLIFLFLYGRLINK